MKSEHDAPFHKGVLDNILSGRRVQKESGSLPGSQTAGGSRPLHTVQPRWPTGQMAGR